MFKLRYTPIAGYVHSVEAVINHAGLRALVAPVPTRPYDPETTLGAENPLGTVPTLIQPDGTALFGGPVIYEFLDSQHDATKLYPCQGPSRFRVLRQAWAADGLFDATVRIIVESWEPQDTQRPHWTARNWTKIERVLDHLNQDAAGWTGLDIGQLRTQGAISFLELKYPVLKQAALGVPASFNWRELYRDLSFWFDRITQNPIFTTPLLGPSI